MSTKLNNFAEVAFSDGESKKSSLHRSVAVGRIGGKSPSRKQNEYKESLKRKKRHLEAWKEQIELEEGVSSREDSDSEKYEDIEDEVSNINKELPLYVQC